MNPDAANEAVKEFERAGAYFRKSDYPAAMGHLEKALKLSNDPAWASYLGYCVARERGQFSKGIELCQKSIREDPGNSDHYLNLGRIYLLSGRKPDAIDVLRQGLSSAPNREIETALLEIGARKPPVFPFLSRENSLNKYAGLLLNRIGLR